MIAMGFKVGDPEYVPGEKDWVYGIKCRGKLLVSGQKVPVDALVIIQVGDGLRDEQDSVAYIDPVYDPFEETTEEETTTEEPAKTENPEVDEFEVVTGPE